MSREHLRPAEPGNQLAVKGGWTSERQIAPRAANHRRRLLRQLRLSPKDLDPVGRGLLDLYVRTASKIALIDDYLAREGMLTKSGNVRPCMKVYVSLVNSSRLALTRLEEHLRERRRDPGSALRDYLEAEYSVVENGD